jgi:hypothetical protein
VLECVGSKPSREIDAATARSAQFQRFTLSLALPLKGEGTKNPPSLREGVRGRVKALSCKLLCLLT